MAQRRTFPQGRLVIKTREALKHSTQAYDDIFLATGIPANWLWRFACGRIPDPGVNRVERLYTHLTGKALVV